MQHLPNKKAMKTDMKLEILYLFTHAKYMLEAFIRKC